MAKSTFLQLCQQTARECRIPGSGPTSVSSQTGEYDRLVRYVKNAELDVKRRYIDWQFMWKTFTGAVAQGANVITTPPTDIGEWDIDSFWLDYGNDDSIQLEIADYVEYRQTIASKAGVSGKPSKVFIAPDDTVYLNSNADVAYTFYGEYWKEPSALSADADESDIPEHTERIIVARAKIYYAEIENAPEIMAGATVEFEDLFDQLVSREGPEQKVKRMFRASRSQQVEVIAG